MNIFKKLKEYGEKKKQESPQEEIEDIGKNKYGVYTNEYTGRTYSDMCKSAAYLAEDAFDGDSEAESNID